MMNMEDSSQLLRLRDLLIEMQTTIASMSDAGTARALGIQLAAFEAELDIRAMAAAEEPQEKLSEYLARFDWEDEED